MAAIIAARAHPESPTFSTPTPVNANWRNGTLRRMAAQKQFAVITVRLGGRESDCSARATEGTQREAAQVRFFDN